MQVICLEEKAFYQLIECVVAKLKTQDNDVGDTWVSSEEAMRILNIKAKSTMQILRDTGKIRFSQPQKKIILYDRRSINAYLEVHAKNTF